MTSEADRIADNIFKFAEKHKLHIHPGRDVKKWAELVIKEAGCPCVPSRRGSCPCEFVLQDIEEENCCRCCLFINDEYLRVYNEFTAKQKSRKKRKSRQQAGTELNDNELVGLIDGLDLPRVVREDLKRDYLKGDRDE